MFDANKVDSAIERMADKIAVLENVYPEDTCAYAKMATALAELTRARAEISY